MSTVSSTHHFRRLGTCDGKLEVGILLPVAEKQREACEEAVVCVSRSCNGLGAGVAVEASFLRFCGAHQLLPVLKFLWFRQLMISQLE